MVNPTKYFSGRSDNLAEDGIALLIDSCSWASEISRLTLTTSLIVNIASPILDYDSTTSATISVISGLCMGGFHVVVKVLEQGIEPAMFVGRLNGRL